MDVIKSARFWIALACLLMIGALALIGKLGAESASGYLMTLLAGYGVGRVDTTKGGGSGTPIAIALVLLMLTGCGGTLGNLHKAQVAISAVDKVAVEVIGKKCLAEAETCGRVGARDCPDYVKCAAIRGVYQKSMKAIDGEMKVIYTLLFDLGVK